MDSCLYGWITEWTTEWVHPISGKHDSEVPNGHVRKKEDRPITCVREFYKRPIVTNSAQKKKYSTSDPGLDSFWATSSNKIALRNRRPWSAKFSTKVKFLVPPPRQNDISFSLWRLCQLARSKSPVNTSCARLFLFLLGEWNCFLFKPGEWNSELNLPLRESVVQLPAELVNKFIVYPAWMQNISHMKISRKDHAFN